MVIIFAMFDGTLGLYYDGGQIVPDRIKFDKTKTCQSITLLSNDQKVIHVTRVLAGRGFNVFF